MLFWLFVSLLVPLERSKRPRKDYANQPVEQTDVLREAVSRWPRPGVWFPGKRHQSGFPYAHLRWRASSAYERCRRQSRGQFLGRRQGSLLREDSRSRRGFGCAYPRRESAPCGIRWLCVAITGWHFLLLCEV